jgi:hypothetical protein
LIFALFFANLAVGGWRGGYWGAYYTPDNQLLSTSDLPHGRVLAGTEELTIWNGGAGQFGTEERGFLERRRNNGITMSV